MKPWQTTMGTQQTKDRNDQTFSNSLNGFQVQQYELQALGLDPANSAATVDVQTPIWDLYPISRPHCNSGISLISDPGSLGFGNYLAGPQHSSQYICYNGDGPNTQRDWERPAAPLTELEACWTGRGSPHAQIPLPIPWNYTGLTSPSQDGGLQSTLPASAIDEDGDLSSSQSVLSSSSYSSALEHQLWPSQPFEGADGRAISSHIGFTDELSNDQDLETPCELDLALSCPYPSCSSRMLFTRMCDLNKHYRLHFRKYYCRVAGCHAAGAQSNMGFTTMKDRNRHERAHNPSIPCPNCGSLFSRYDNFQSHFRTVHGPG
ncbi:hypothetical protein CC79DRAFT_566805 [Sarocladium strictum]